MVQDMGAHRSKVSGGPWLSKTGICSRQDAKNAKSGSLISLRPLRRRSGHALRLCGRYSEFWLRLGRAGFYVVKDSNFATTKDAKLTKYDFCRERKMKTLVAVILVSISLGGSASGQSPRPQ